MGAHIAKVISACLWVAKSATDRQRVRITPIPMVMSAPDNINIIQIKYSLSEAASHPKSIKIV